MVPVKQIEEPRGDGTGRTWVRCEDKFGNDADILVSDIKDGKVDTEIWKDRVDWMRDARAVAQRKFGR